MAIRCSKCGRPLYNRRRGKCEMCGAPIDSDQQLSGQQQTKLERLREDEKRRHREFVERGLPERTPEIPLLPGEGGV